MQVSEKLQAQLPLPVRAWIEAFNAHDVAAITALYADDAELFDSGMRYPRRGRVEIERWFSRRFYSMPTIAYMPQEPVLIAPEQAAVAWTTRGHGPRLAGLRCFARPFKVEGVSIFRLQEGLIQWQRGYYDHLAVVEQIVPLLKWCLPARL
ncbi:nuclear transport factor 2 family protein [Ktedonosporobacter rubrisoli]|uniref:Nuclear transport factor 2 family protein n=1 Tax=Ktedonosporobacter rubrisoli TaxID=2509675 RepID=A0A4P6K155_KTERU|nr:nuclear transport factor 2 family protein [Ktedonosporobacter rubrisoli]QBD81563.1 nuclear transport factor 2 family protein [Ktedonosporobacter rubrisoli]